MAVIIPLIIFVGLAAVIVWVADYTSVGARRYKALAILNRRLASGEIDRAEYEEKRKLIGR
ncbi:MAG TPA: SHOCT domain-containing protein [Xanthobacteraceae bacterium]|nr:SHOCT domain-containing protein [Xanthobacteraceae bacterium]